VKNKDSGNLLNEVSNKTFSKKNRRDSLNVDALMNAVMSFNDDSDSISGPFFPLNSVEIRDFNCLSDNNQVTGEMKLQKELDGYKSENAITDTYNDVTETNQKTNIIPNYGESNVIGSKRNKNILADSLNSELIDILTDERNFEITNVNDPSAKELEKEEKEKRHVYRGFTKENSESNNETLDQEQKESMVCLDVFNVIKQNNEIKSLRYSFNFSITSFDSLDDDQSSMWDDFDNIKEIRYALRRLSSMSIDDR